MHNTSSKDDSPDILGSFTDGGGAGLRDNSFRVYADNRRRQQRRQNPIWNFRVDGNDTVLDADGNVIAVAQPLRLMSASMRMMTYAGLCEDDWCRRHCAGTTPVTRSLRKIRTTTRHSASSRAMDVYHSTEADTHDDDADLTSKPGAPRTTKTAMLLAFSTR